MKPGQSRTKTEKWKEGKRKIRCHNHHKLHCYPPINGVRRSSQLDQEISPSASAPFSATRASIVTVPLATTTPSLESAAASLIHQIAVRGNWNVRLGKLLTWITIRSPSQSLHSVASCL